jgi:hypothetical protein
VRPGAAQAGRQQSTRNRNNRNHERHTAERLDPALPVAEEIIIARPFEHDFSP